MLQRRRLSRGLTLLEVLLVVVVLGVLAAIVIPNLSVFKRRALVSSAKATLTLVYSAGQMYRTDQGQFPPGSGVTLNASHPLVTQGYLQVLPATEWTYVTTNLGGSPPAFQVRASGAKQPVIGYDATTQDGVTYSGTPAGAW